MLKYKIIVYDVDNGPDETSITIAGYCADSNDLACIARTAGEVILTSTDTYQTAALRGNIPDDEPE